MKLKDRISFFFFDLDNPLYEVCLIRIQVQVKEKRSTIDTHMNAECLLKNTSKIARYFLLPSTILLFDNVIILHPFSAFNLTILIF